MISLKNDHSTHSYAHANAMCENLLHAISRYLKHKFIHDSTQIDGSKVLHGLETIDFKDEKNNIYIWENDPHKTQSTQHQKCEKSFFLNEILINIFII